MKTYLIHFLFLSISLPSFGQVFVGGVNINTLDSVKVIEVMTVVRPFKKGVDAFVDYGQKDIILAFDLAKKSDDLRITNSEQLVNKVFLSTAAVLNFLENNGWELLHTRTFESRNYFYFRKRQK